VHVIVIALGSAGDVHPLIGLSLTLRRRGHDVLMIGPSFFRNLAERVGLEYAGIGTGDEYREALRDPDLWHPTRSFSVVARRLIVPALQPVYEMIQNRRRADTVLASACTAFAARIAQEKLRVPLATTHLQPIMLRSAQSPACFGFPDVLGHLPPVLRRVYYRVADALIVDPPVANETNRFRAELGLAPVTRLFNSWIHSPDLVIGLFPEWFSPPPADWPPNVALTGFPLWDESEVRMPSSDLKEFLSVGDPPLVFTAGSANLQGKKFFDVSADVCRVTGRRGLLLTQFPEQLPLSLPNGVRHFHYVPFSEVLPRSLALIHHGGIGTMSQAIAAGIPQLVIPTSHDQPDNAVRVRRMGIGDFLRPDEYKTEQVVEKLAALQNPVMREECRRRAADVASCKGLEMAANLIERLGTAGTAISPQS
jgi:rhamnosyltransferase subunit B